MNKLKDIFSIIGLAVVIMTFFLSLTVIIVATHQGLVSGTLLSDCRQLHQRQCELVAVPKEVE